MSVGWGIISTGNHPDRKVVPAMKAARNTDVVAAYSRSMETAQEFASRHDIPSAYDSLDGILQDPNVNAVFISSPNHVHATHTIAAAKARKHVLVEKPMATTMRDASDMVRTCRDNGVKLGVGFQLRFHPGHIKARQVIQSGSLGVISLIQGQWSLGRRGVVEPVVRTGRSAWWGDPMMMGGAFTLMGTGVHVIDLLQFIMDEPIVEVAAITDGQTEERPMEQAAAVAIRFRNGTIGTIVAGSRMPDAENDAMVYGSNGKIALRGTLWEAQTGSLEIVSEHQDLSESYKEDLITLYRMQTESFNRALENDEEFHASGEDGLSAVQVTLAIIESASTGRAVSVDPIAD